MQIKFEIVKVFLLLAKLLKTKYQTKSQVNFLQNTTSFVQVQYLYSTIILQSK